MLRFFVFLHKISGYNAILISTIVDYFCIVERKKQGYNAILISTIVDDLRVVCRPHNGYNAILISTIVDFPFLIFHAVVAIMLF